MAAKNCRVWLSNRLSRPRCRAVRRYDVQRKPDPPRARSRPVGARSHCGCGQRGGKRGAVEKDRRQPHDTGAGGRIFARVKPKLAVYNHLLLFGSATAGDLIPATRQKYAGPLTVGWIHHKSTSQEVQASPREFWPAAQWSAAKSALLDHAFCIAANIRFGVNGTSRILTPTASKIALAIAAGTGTVASSPAPSGATSWRLIKTMSTSGMSGNFKIG